MQIHMTLRHYLFVIWQHMRLIIIGVSVCTTATFIISQFIPPVYQATTLVKVNNKTAEDVFSAQASTIDYALLVTSPEVLRQAALNLPNMTSSQLKEAVRNSAIDNTQIIEIQAKSNSAQQASEIANVVAATFIQVQVERETVRIQNASDRLTKEISNTRVDLDNAQKQLTTMQSANESAESIAQQKSTVDTHQANYKQLLSDNSELQQQKLQANNILSIVQVAAAPDQPSSPQILLNTLLAAICSSVAMIVVALLLDWLDTTIKTEEDVTMLGNGVALGSIPQLEVAQNTPHALQQLNHPLQENFTILATRLRIEQQKASEPRTIMVTSLKRMAGSTTVSLHLASALAATGMRILLVDGNTYHPTLHSWLHIPNTQGLLNSLDDFQPTHRTDVPLSFSWLNQWQTTKSNLWFLPLGPTPMEEVSQLPLEALKNLQKWLLGDSTSLKQIDTRLIDLIIIDTSELEQGSSAKALATLADASILVIEAGKVQKETVQQAQKTLEQLQAPLLGVVLNRQKIKHGAYHYVEQQASETQVQVTPAEPLMPVGSLTEPIARLIPTTPMPEEIEELSIPAPAPRLQLPVMPLKRQQSLLPRLSLPTSFAGEQQSLSTYQKPRMPEPETPISLPIVAETPRSQFSPFFQRKHVTGVLDHSHDPFA